MPTLVQLEYALAVEKLRHFGKASQLCRVTQPTLSQQLQKLEDEVGIILFDRSKQPVLPTPEGKRFLDQARVVIRESEKLKGVSKLSIQGELSGEFKLGVIPTVASHLLPLFIGEFSKSYPQVELLIQEMKTETILKELGDDGLDGAILATPISGLDFKIHPLYYESFYVYFSKNHPLLKFDQITREQLVSDQMWLLEDGHCFKDQVLNFCLLPKKRSHPDEKGLPPVRFQSGSLDTLLRLVQRSEEGYTLIPAMMVNQMKREGEYGHVRPFKPPIPTREISLIYRRDHWKLAILSAIEKIIVSHLPKDIRAQPDKVQKILEVS